jgi:hypothetical protein
MLKMGSWWLKRTVERMGKWAVISEANADCANCIVFENTSLGELHSSLGTYPGKVGTTKQVMSLMYYTDRAATD